MHPEWEKLDTNTLRRLYLFESESLKASLLNGALWEEVQDQRKKVTELAIILHRRKHQHSSRESPGPHPEGRDQIPK